MRNIEQYSTRKVKVGTKINKKNSSYGGDTIIISKNKTFHVAQDGKGWFVIVEYIFKLFWIFPLKFMNPLYAWFYKAEKAKHINETIYFKTRIDAILWTRKNVKNIRRTGLVNFHFIPKNILNEDNKL